MSKKKRESRGGLKTDAAVVVHLQAIGVFLEEQKDDPSIGWGNVEASIGHILDLVKEKSIERKTLVHKSSNGIDLLLTCFKRSSDSRVIHDILLIFKSLCEHRHKTKLVRHGAVDVLLKSLTSCSDDRVLLLHLSLLNKLAGEDKKFVIKARLSGTLPVIAAFLKRSYNDPSSLPVILSMVKTLAVNATNATSLGRHGCISLFPRLLTAYGSHDYKILSYVLRAYAPLLSKKSNSLKKAVVVSVHHLVSLFQRLHQVDSAGRHISLRKSILNILLRVLVAESCLQSFHKAGGLTTLFHIARELSEDSRRQFRSLSTLTCSVLQKALPKRVLPVPISASPIPFALDEFRPPLLSEDHSLLSVDCPLLSEDHIETESVILEQTEKMPMIHPVSSLGILPVVDQCEHTSLVPEHRNQSDPTFNETIERLQCLRVSSARLSKTKLAGTAKPKVRLPTSWFVGIGREGGVSTTESDTACFDRFFPEYDFLCDLPLQQSYSSISPEDPRRAVSSPNITTQDYNERVIATPLTTPFVSVSDLSARRQLDLLQEPPSMIIEEYLKKSSQTKKSIFSLLSSLPSYSSPEPFYKRSPRVYREILLQDVERFIDPSSLLNKVLYDMDDLLAIPPISPGLFPVPPEIGMLPTDSQPNAGSEENNNNSRPCIKIPNCSDPPGQTSREVGVFMNSSISSEPKQQQSAVKTLCFSSLSESCNLRKAVQVRDYEYDLVLSPDINTDHHHQWFLFEVTNMTAGPSYRFNIINCEKPDSQFNYGMQPVLFSSLSGGWSRVGKDILYYRSNTVFSRTKSGSPCDSNSSGEAAAGGTTVRQKSGKREASKTTKRFYTLTFTVTFPHNQDTCCLAYHFPYTYTMLRCDLSRMEQSLFSKAPGSSRLYYKRQSLCSTLSGVSCPLVTITNLPSSRLQDEGGLNQKEYIVLSSRVHPGETNSSWIMKGVMEFLCSSDPDAEKLRDLFVFKIVPMLNPDGVINGSHRCSLSGQDLNRQWISPDPLMHPTIFHTKGLIQWLIERDTKPYLFCDFHGHSRRKNVFLFGCRNSLDVKRLSLILHETAPLFSVHNCSFVVEKSKEATGRVVVWRMGVNKSYTMESTYCGADQGPSAGYQVRIEDLVEMGKAFCVSLLKLATSQRHDSSEPAVETPEEKVECDRDLTSDEDVSSEVSSAEESVTNESDTNM